MIPGMVMSRVSRHILHATSRYLGCSPHNPQRHNVLSFSFNFLHLFLRTSLTLTINQNKPTIQQSLLSKKQQQQKGKGICIINLSLKLANILKLKNYSLGSLDASFARPGHHSDHVPHRQRT